MAQNVRDLLSNRKFAIPLIALLGICFVGLLLLGFVLILPSLNLGGSQPVAQATPTEAADVATSAPATPTKAPTATARPSPTLVPVGTVVDSGSGQDTGTPVSAATTTPVMGADEAATATAQAAPTESSAEGSPTPGAEGDELADTGVGWGLIFVSGGGLAAIAIAARRLRMAG